MSEETSTYVVRKLVHEDRAVWTKLFWGYAEFYERTLGDDELDVVWRWIFEDELIVALVVTLADSSDEPVGLAHLREWIRPLRASVNVYLDDLFVAPDHRGTGAVDELFAAIIALARQRHWPLVRWTTATDNFRAQSVYNKYAMRTSWVTYDLTVTDVGR